MSEVAVTFPDGSQNKFPAGTTLLDMASSIDEALGKRAVAAKVDGQIMDLTRKVERDCMVEFLTFDDDEGKEVYWHSASHVMADAVKMLFPDAKLAIGPAISDGFYYDFDVEKPFVPEDLEQRSSRLIFLSCAVKYRNPTLLRFLPISKKIISWNCWKIWRTKRSWYTATAILRISAVARICQAQDY